jgi:integrase
MGLGPLHTVSLKEARERARCARQQILDGVDPLDARKAQRAAQALQAARSLTFEDAAQQYFNTHEKKWRNAKHRAQFLSSLRAYAFKKIGKLPIADIDLGLVLKVIEPIWRDKTETANRVRGRIESVLDWAAVRGYRTGENPARWRGHLQHVLPARGRIARLNHHPAMPYADLPTFMLALTQREGIAARALEFTILTAARTGEVIGATWDEIDLSAKVWIIPARRMKARREHRVWLSDRVLQILKSLPHEEGNNSIFIGQRGCRLSDMTMAALLKRMGRNAAQPPRHSPVVHGFRSTFRDWAAERTNYPNHVIEMALAHVIDNKVEAAYRRGDLFEKRKRLMSDWSRYCAMIPAATTNLVPLKQAV